MKYIHIFSLITLMTSVQSHAFLLDHFDQTMNEMMHEMDRMRETMRESMHVLQSSSHRNEEPSSLTIGFNENETHLVISLAINGVVADDIDARVNQNNLVVTVPHEQGTASVTVSRTSLSLVNECKQERTNAQQDDKEEQAHHHVAYSSSSMMRPLPERVLLDTVDVAYNDDKVTITLSVEDNPHRYKKVTVHK